MELTKQKYKQTEVGLIPDDWKLVPFDTIFSFYSTSNYSKAQMSEDDEVGCIHYGLIHAIKNTKYDLKHGIKYYVTSEQAKCEFVRDGDVIMVDASEDLEGVNKSVEVFGVGNNKYIPGLHTYLLRDKKSLLADNFRGMVLNSQSVKNQMLKLAVGMKVFGVSKTQLINIKIALPPTLAEQKAIATALSDVDELISNLDQLITKKKAIKQGAMQQLLTPPDKGGKRLEGFSGEWVEKTVGDIVEYKNGAAHENCVVENGEYIIVNSKFVSTEGRVAKHSNKNLCPVNKNEILMVLSDIPNGKAIAKCYYVEENNKYTLNQRICSFKTEKSDSKFLFLLLNRNPYYLQFDDGVKQTNLRNEDVLSCPLTLSPTIEEQKQISKIIFDLDKDIKNSLVKRKKYQDIKQGMMQELLTGKTRLV
ncbi:restriction endonuclease subunit S [Flavobacterium petrolei]|uniref:restriction endonuclease subunit S n=1 Tax=Flavobacterium petrolei TaxID=2259594 RepID=UPI0037573C43